MTARSGSCVSKFSFCFRSRVRQVTRFQVSGVRYDTGTMERWNDGMLENVSIIGQCSTAPVFQYSAKLEAETQNSKQIQMAEKDKIQNVLVPDRRLEFSEFGICLVTVVLDQSPMDASAARLL